SKFISTNLYLDILDDLGSIQYSGEIQFGRYNEPLSFRHDFLGYVRMARRRVPRASLYTHTNGDFLDREYLEELKSAGLDRLEIQTYLGNDQRYDEAKMLAAQDRQLRRLSLKRTKPIAVATGLRHYYETDYPGMTVRVDARNFDEIGTDRGGLV